MKVVSKTFKEIVLDSQQDVLLEIYSATCPHCIGFQPTFEQTANHFAKTNPNLIVAQVEAEKNDIQHFLKERIGMYPTILFFPAHDKDNYVYFEADREFANLVDFIDLHQTMSISHSDEL